MKQGEINTVNVMGKGILFIDGKKGRVKKVSDLSEGDVVTLSAGDGNAVATVNQVNIAKK